MLNHTTILQEGTYESDIDSNKIHIMRVLSRRGVIASDLVAIYVALVRSFLEYRCVVWHNALPAYLSGEIERIQMRGLR